MTTILLALGVTACSGADEDPSVKDDKQITVYSGRSEALVKPLLEKFTKKSGITVHARYAGSAAMATQLLEEGAKSPADVFFSQDAGALGAVAKKGLFAPLPAAALEQVPSGYRSRTGEWIGVSARARALVFNPSLAPEDRLPATVFDLTKPEWRGKVGVAPTNASFQTFITAITVQHGEDKAKEFLAGLKANDPKVHENNVAIVEAVDAGKLATGLVNHYYLGEISHERGITPDKMTAKLHFFPDGDTGALVNVAGLGVLDKAADDKDVRAFLDYLLSPEAQKHLAENTFEYPIVAGVEQPAGVPALAELKAPPIDLNDLDQLEKSIGLIKESGLLP